MVVAVLAGLVVGLLLGALGGGGSILTVPVLVYALGQGTATATTASLVIVGISSLVAAAGHTRRGRVRWRAGLVFGLVGSVTALLGSLASRAVPPQVLLLLFATLMLVAAAAMGCRDRPSAEGEAPGESDGPRRDPAVPGEPGSAGTTRVAERTTPAPAASGPWRSRSTVVVAALVVGLLTGFFGVGGGFVIVPALVLALSYPMPVAVATSLVVISVNSAAGLVARWGSVAVPWHVVVPFTLAAIAASLLGRVATDRVSPTALSRAFVVLLVLVAGYVATRAVVAL